MNPSFTLRRWSAACVLFAGSFLAVFTAHAQDAAKAASPANITVRSEAATPIRVILPSLWEEKSTRNSDAAVNAVQR
jgi:hypothetical protein